MSLKNYEVLILDDDPDFKVLIKRILENIGAVLVEASTISEGLSLLKSRVPHLVLLDLNLAGESGFSFIKEVKQSNTLKKIPIVILSANASPSHTSRAIAFGASDYITKPIATATLLQKIRKTLRLEDFAKKIFSAEERPKASIKIEASINALSETECILQAPIKFIPGSKVILKSKLMDDLGAGSCKFETKSPVTSSSSGSFNNSLMIKGANDEVIQNIRKFQKKLRKA